jgi:hypothetical protein
MIAGVCAPSAWHSTSANLPRREYQDCKESLAIVMPNENSMETPNDHGLEAYEVLADGRYYTLFITAPSSATFGDREFGSARA